MKRIASSVAALSASVLVGALSIWAIWENPAREVDKLAENALCVLELKPGQASTSTSFTTSRPIPTFHVGARSRARNERLWLSISGGDGASYNGEVNEVARFSFGLNLRPGAYQVALRQEAGDRGGLVAIADRTPTASVTGWQVWSRMLVGLVLLSGVWALLARAYGSPGSRVASSQVFGMLLLCVVMMLSYLLLHEGGHALGQIAFGRFDWSRSDFLGIHGHPCSGGKPGPPLEPWQQAVISGGGIMVPVFAGWLLFLLWRSRAGRRWRSIHPTFNLYLSALVAVSLFSFVVVAGYLPGLITDGDWEGFIRNVPGPLWVIKSILWGMLLVNALILVRVGPEAYRARLGGMGRRGTTSHRGNRPSESSIES